MLAGLISTNYIKPQQELYTATTLVIKPACEYIQAIRGSEKRSASGGNKHLFTTNKQLRPAQK